MKKYEVVDVRNKKIVLTNLTYSEAEYEMDMYNLMNGDLVCGIREVSDSDV